MLVTTENWASAFPGAVVGVLVMREVCNPELSSALEVSKRDLEAHLREQAARSVPESIASEPVTHAYVDYFRAHGKTYHMQAQWESVALKRKPIPRKGGAHRAMFIAELRNLILTAGHDLTAVVPRWRPPASRLPAPCRSQLHVFVPPSDVAVVLARAADGFPPA